MQIDFEEQHFKKGDFVYHKNDYMDEQRIPLHGLVIDVFHQKNDEFKGEIYTVEWCNGDSVNYYNNEKFILGLVTNQKEKEIFHNLSNGDETLVFNQNDSINELLYILKKSFPFYYTSLTKNVIQHITSVYRYPFYFGKKSNSKFEWGWGTKKPNNQIREIKYYIDKLKQNE